jgi:hypothetical protein
MPRVPEMDSPSVGMTPFQAPGASAAGADVFDIPDIAGKQATQLGTAMLSTGAIFKKIADNIEYDLADAQAKDLDVKVAQADQTTIEGYLKLSGKAAVDARAETYKNLEKNRESILQTLKDEGKPASPLVEQMFKNAASRRLEIATHQMSSHFVQQAKIYDNAASTARVSQSVNDANRILISDPAAFKQVPSKDQPTNTYWTLRNTAITEVNLMADKNGVPKEGDGSEIRKQMLLEVTTKMHMDAVNNFVKQAEKTPGAIKLAAEYLDTAVKAGEISADKIDDLANLVKTGGQNQQSLDLFMELKSMPIDKAISELQKRNKAGLVDAEVLDRTQQRLEHNYTFIKQKQAENEKSVIGAAQDFLIKNPQLGINALPANIYNELKRTGHLGTIQSFAKSGRFDNDPQTWGQILSMPQSELAKMTPDQFYTKYRGKLDDSHLERGMEYVLGLKNPDKTKDVEMVSTRTIAEEITFAAKQNKIIAMNGASNANQQAAFGAFDTEINNRLRDYQINTLGGKRKPNSDEAKQIINDVLADKVKIDEFGRDPEMSIAVVTPDKMPKAYVTVGGRDIYLSKIPQPSREKYISILRSRNITPSQAKIAQMWAADNPEK